MTSTSAPVRLRPRLPDRLGAGRNAALGASTLRCPECEWNGGGVYDQEIVDRFDEELDAGHRVGARRSRASSPGRTWRTRSSASSPPWPRTRSSPKTSRLPQEYRSTTPSATSSRSSSLLGVECGASGERLLRRLRPARGRPARPGRARRWRRSGRRPPRRPLASSVAQVQLGEPGSRSRARISGRVTVPSSRSVPRALPVRSGGPVTSRTSSRSWKASPISRPNTSSGRSPGRRRGLRPPAADQARALEQARRLQLAALQVALGAEIEVSKASRRWASSPAASATEASVSSSTWRAAPSAELGEGAREQQVAGRERAVARPERARPRSGGRGEAARRRARRRGPASPCGRARSRSRRGSASPSGAGPAQSRTSSGRSRLPPAASVAPASRRERLAVAFDEPPSGCSTASMPARQPGAGASSTGVTGGGTADAVTRCSHAAGVDRDDPAGDQRPADPLEPGDVHAAPPAPRAGGKRFTDSGRYE